MPQFKFKTRKNKFNFFNDDDILNTEILNSTHTEIFSNKKIIIEGCRNIIDYQDDHIALAIKKSNINILGTEFKIMSYDEKRIEICGNISSIEFGV